MSEELETEPTDTTPKSVTIGNTKLIADARANTIIVLGTREVVVKVERILDEMDVKAPQVALSTVIGELTWAIIKSLGSIIFLDTGEWWARRATARSPFQGLLLAASPAVTTGILDPGGLVNFANVLENLGAGTNVYVQIADGLSAIVHALDSTGNFKVISRPMVFTTNNKKAIIASGKEIPVPVSTDF